MAIALQQTSEELGLRPLFINDQQVHPHPDAMS